MKKLPVGIQSFKVIREDGYYYVDKTPFVKRLTDEGKFYFLSRPRRFGKSLFLDTLRQAFLGRRELFEGLYLENNWDWEEKHPVIYISFGAGVIKGTSHLLTRIEEILKTHERYYEVNLSYQSVEGRFQELIDVLSKRLGQKAVVLIDEYDKPILDNIERKEAALEIREALKNFYSVIKDADEFLKFCFITGVSKFSKVSLFSGLNNLEDITISSSYATICGYTRKDLETVFKERLKGVDLKEVRRWYNGYSWLGEPVYNPFDMLLFLKEKLFRPYWFETGTPSFLIRLLAEKNYYLPRLENISAGEELLESFEIEDIKAETLLFQTGYLTIRQREEIIKGKWVYHLRFPNLEVRAALTDHLLSYLVKDTISKNDNEIEMARAIRSGNLEDMFKVFKSFFSSIPHDWYRRNELSGYEGFYASIFYCYFTALGLDVRVEDATSHGRLDMAVIFDRRCYLFEFKVVETGPEKKALRQLKEKAYHEKYKGSLEEIWLIGVEFSKKKRNITGFEFERA